MNAVDYVKLGLNILKNDVANGEIVTRLFIYKDNTLVKLVEDYSPFANEKYMSKDLLNSLKNGLTLTEELLDELNMFKIDKAIKL